MISIKVEITSEGIVVVDGVRIDFKEMLDAAYRNYLMETSISRQDALNLAAAALVMERKFKRDANVTTSRDESIRLGEY